MLPKGENSALNVWKSSIILSCSAQKGSIVIYFSFLVMTSCVSHLMMSITVGHFSLNISVLPTSPWTCGPNYDCGSAPLLGGEIDISSSSVMESSLHDGWMLMPKDFEWLTLNPHDEQRGSDKLNSTKSKGAACKRDSEKNQHIPRGHRNVARWQQTAN